MEKDEAEAKLLDYGSLVEEVAAFYDGAKPPRPLDEAALLDVDFLRDEIAKHHPKLPEGLIDLSFTDDPA